MPVASAKRLVSVRSLTPQSSARSVERQRLGEPRLDLILRAV